MSDFEMLSIVLMILSIVVTVLIAYINQVIKSNRPWELVCSPSRGQ